MPAGLRVAPRITAWQASHRGLPAVPGGGGFTGGVPFLDQFVAGYRFGARIYPGADTTQDPTTWTPVDVSAHILQPGDGGQPAITITRGRLGEQQQTSAASCTFTLRNDPAKGNGDYSPRRVTGRFWPYMKAGLPVDVFINTALATFVRFAGRVESLEPGFDETSNYSVITVTAYGVLYDIEQGATPLRSPLYRALSAAVTGQVAYWALEDGADATQAASEIVGVRPMRAGGAGTVSFGQPGVGGTAAYVDTNDGGTLYGQLVGGTATDHWAMLVGFEIQDTTSSKSAYPLFWTTSTGMACAFLFTFAGATTGTGIDIFVAGPGAGGGGPANGGGDTVLLGSLFTATDWQVGTFHTVLFYTFTVAGGFNIGAIVDGVDSATLFPTGIVADMTGNPGALRRIHVNPDANDFAYISLLYDSSVVSNAMGVAHVKAWQPWASATTANIGAAATGYTGETPSTRLARISAEEHIPFALPAGPSDPARTMGPQQVDTLYNIARDCETVEGGVLEDGVNFGWQLWTVESRYNQTTAAFTPALTQLQPPFAPVENTLRVRNDVTASQPSGTSARYSQPSGQPYAVTGPGGLGGRSLPVTMNVEDPDLLLHRAAWLVHLGTVDADRYAPLAVNLAARTGLIGPWLAVGNGDRWTTTSTYPTGASAGPDVLVEGWTEGLGRMVYGVAANTAPADPWNVLVLDDPVYGRIGSDNSTLAAGVAAGVTGAVSVNVGTLWSTAAGDYPLDMNISGERVTVSGVAGAASPQTFTISARAVNGVSKDLAAGAKVDLWLPLVIGP